MLARWEFWVTTGVALLAAVIAGYTMMLFAQNQGTRAELAQRSLYVQRTMQLEVLYRDVAKALADLSLRNQDKALSDLLATQGITINVPAVTAPPSTPPAPVANPGTRP